MKTIVLSAGLLPKNGCIAGFADLTISEIAEHYPTFFSGFSLLLTCLDSRQQLSQYGERLRSTKSNWDVQVVGESVFIGAKHVENFLFEPNILVHFDELYLLTHPPPALRISEIFTTDRANFSESVPTSFFEIFRSVDARRYLSDGCGLNFACEDVAIAKRIGEIEKRVVGENR